MRRLRRVRGQAIDDGQEFQGREAVAQAGLGRGEEQRVIVQHQQRLEPAVAEHLLEGQARGRSDRRSPALLQGLAGGILGRGAVAGEVLGGGAHVPHPPDVGLLGQHEQRLRRLVAQGGHGHVGRGGGQRPRRFRAQVRQRLHHR